MSIPPGTDPERPIELPALAPSSNATPWWDTLHDEELSRLVNDALGSSHSLRQTEARAREARAALGLSAATLFPSLTANASADRERETENGTIPPPFRGATIDNTRATLDLSWELDAWSKNRAARRGAAAQAHAAALDRDWAASLLATAVAQAYFQCEADDHRRQLAAEVAELRSQLTYLAKRRLAAGLEPLVTRRQAESDRALSRLTLQQIDTAQKVDRDQLLALLGRAHDEGTAFAAASLPSAPPLDGAIWLELLARRADVRAALLRIDSAREQETIARAQFFPDVNLSALIGVQSITFSKLTDPGSGIASAGPALHLPIFDGGRLRAGLAVSQAQYDEAVDAYNQVVVAAAQDAKDQLATYVGLSEQIQQAQDALAATEQLAAALDRRRAAGLIDAASATQARIGVLTQQDVLLQLRARQLAVYAALMRALGAPTGASVFISADEGKNS